MAKKTSQTEEGGIKKFTIESGSAKQEAVCKIAMPTIRIGEDSDDNCAVAQLNRLIIQAVEETSATHLRGTLTLYKK